MQAQTPRAAPALALLSLFAVGTALAQEATPSTAAPSTTAVATSSPTTPPTRVVEPEALDLVKKMSDKLASTQSFLVRTRSSLETPAGTGQLIDFFAESAVAVKRPDKLSAEIRGDAPPFDLYFDGKTMTAYEPAHKLYATADAPKTLDELVPFAAKTAGILLPFADVLYSDAYAVLTKDLTSAFYAGYSVIRGNRCEHVALATPGIAGQLWIDAKTHLPCRIGGTLLDVQGAPRFSVEYYDWKPNHKLPDKLFHFAKPDGADAMDFRALTGAGR